MAAPTASGGARDPGARDPDDRDAGDRDPGARDRDPGGRARNARPRDALGRPLAYGADGVPVLPDELAEPSAAVLEAAQRLIDDGRPFAAHELLEAAWKSAAPAERDLWQGLTQLAVGMTHALRGNAHGAATLLRRGAARLAGYAGQRPYGADPAALSAAAAELADRIESDGLAAAGPVSLRLVE
jgi:uncharacterized protein